METLIKIYIVGVAVLSAVMTLAAFTAVVIGLVLLWRLL